MTKQNKLLSFMDNKVTCVVGPKCEHTQLIFPFKPNLFEFSTTKFIQNSISSTP
jgi:hypothetical protein